VTVNSTATIDYSALQHPVSRADVVAYRRAARAAGKPWAKFKVGSIVAVCIGVVAGLLIAFATVSTFVSVSRHWEGLRADEVILFLMPLGVLLVFAVIGARLVVRGRGKWRRWLRLSRFAEANALLFSPQDPPAGYPGAVFTVGTSRTVTDHLTSTSGRFVDLGNYTYVTGSGKSSTTHRWGFVAVKLDRRLPNMVLDAKSNNRLFGTTNLPETFSKSQRLSVEGDFDRYFTLYCPKEYERDALYVFTPDLLALLIDQSQQFDVEIVDDWMFVYSSEPLRMADAATLDHLFRIVDTVGAKTVTQTERYSDDRVGNRAINMVAPGGRRLKVAFPVLGLVALVLSGAFWLWTTIRGG
jgi:hypothetical protein